jgi:uncharacterized protein YjiS (DUF1127 family)
MATFDLTLPPQPHSRWQPARARAPIHRLAAAWGVVSLWIARVRQRDALAALDDHELRDIGITRAEAAREWEKPFWR